LPRFSDIDDEDDVKANPGSKDVDAGSHSDQIPSNLDNDIEIVNESPSDASSFDHPDDRAAGIGELRDISEEPQIEEGDGSRDVIESFPKAEEPKPIPPFDPVTPTYVQVDTNDAHDPALASSWVPMIGLIQPTPPGSQSQSVQDESSPVTIPNSPEPPINMGEHLEQGGSTGSQAALDDYDTHVPEVQSPEYERSDNTSDDKDRPDLARGSNRSSRISQAGDDGERVYYDVRRKGRKVQTPGRAPKRETVIVHHTHKSLDDLAPGHDMSHGRWR